ncbi:hypothetical protein DsansV1_C09g0093681 [Dioscorea sansibarensis]
MSMNILLAGTICGFDLLSVLISVVLHCLEHYGINTLFSVLSHEQRWHEICSLSPSHQGVSL